MMSELIIKQVNRMNIERAMRLLLPTALLLLSAPSQAEGFTILTASSCAQVPRKALVKLIDEIGSRKGYNFPDDQRISAQLRCVPAGENYTYMYRITLEKARKENNAVWIKVLDERVSYGVLSADLMVGAIKSATQELTP
jgi:hypothetical protein